jgi:hypothetical protein
MMDARAPDDGAIRITIPIAITAIPIERRKKMWNNRGDVVDKIHDALATAGWDHKRKFTGAFALTVQAAYIPEPGGLPKYKQAALKRGEKAFRQGSPQLGTLADILIEATQLSHGQIVRLVVERVYGGEGRLDIVIEPVKL